MELRKIDPEYPKSPPMTKRHLLRKAAAYFHTDGIDGMLRKPVERRAEMMAHILLEEAREGYIEWKRVEKAKQKEKAKTGYNPAERQRKRWMVGS